MSIFTSAGTRPAPLRSKAISGKNQEHYLTKHGLLYPRSILNKGNPGHVGFAASVGNETENAKRRPEIRTLSRQLELLDVELEEKQPKSVLISSETFLPSMNPVKDFKDPRLLSAMPRMTGARIIYYARHPRSAALSKYKQVIKSPVWRYEGDFQTFCDQWAPCGNPWTLIAPWAEAFGPENLILRPFDSPSMGGVDILEDFGAVLGTGITAERQQGRQNSSPSLYATEALRRMRIDGTAPNSHQDVIAFLVQTDQDTPEDTIRDFEAEYLESLSGTLDSLENQMRSDLDRFVSTYGLSKDFF